MSGTEESIGAADYGLSPMQKGMLFHLLHTPGSGSDVEQMVMRFHESVDRLAIERAWEATAARHEVLRTSFVVDNTGHPVQRVQPNATIELVEIDQRAYDREQAERRLTLFLATDRKRSFDPATAPLSRVAIFRRTAGDIVVWTFHHILLDGRSFPIVVADFFDAYDTIGRGQEPALEPSVPYRHFIDGLAAKDMTATRHYWAKTLAGFTAPTPLAVDGIGAIDPTTGGFGEVNVSLDAPTTSALHTLATNYDLTLNTFLQASWARLLSIYSGETDIVFGATRSGRYGVIPDAESIAGLFINTVPMRIAVPPEADLVDWLQEIRTQHLNLRDHEHLPLVDIQGLSEVRSGNRLFDSILVFESYQLDPMMRQRAGTGSRVDYELHEQTNHPLLLSVYGGERLDLRLEYDRSKFDQAVAERMIGHVANLLRAMAGGLGGSVGDLNCLGDDERDLVTRIWADRSVPTPATDLVSLWQDRVAQWPDRPAVIGVDETLTYAELDRRSDQVATGLAEQGAQAGHVVAILIDRSVGALVAILGVLKSGAAYLPLDPDYPPERLRHMVTDSGASIVVTDRADRYAESVGAGAATGARALHLDELVGRGPSWSGPTPDSPAYLIYTSGSTGRPKGVRVAHHSVVNHALGTAATYRLGPGDRVLQFAALSFDVAAEELFPTWLSGGTVVLRPDSLTTSFDELHRFIDHHQITVVNLPAAYWSVWVDHLFEERIPIPASLQTVVVGSDKVLTADRDRWIEVAPPTIRWFNAYGPTEATITATVLDPMGADPAPGPVMPIGRPIPNLSCLVVDDGGMPTPIGVPGELWIGGRGVAIGYHQRPELTADRFVPDPRTGDTDTRFYRTGDLARWLPDGNLEFLGRVDDQVKIRGFRIELGEIESALRDLDGVEQAAAVAQTDQGGGARLEAHVVPTPESRLDPADLRVALGRRLPAYMVPAGIATIAQLPLTPSGKVDRSALPVIGAGQAERENVAPRTRREHQLTGLWEEVLGTAPGSVNDDFFDAGGNSLSAIRLFAGIRDLTGLRLELSELFAAPTVAELATILDARVPAELEETNPEPPVANDLPPWVVPVKASGSRPPLFHLGGASVLRALARHLPEDQPLYAVLEQDLGADHFATTVDDIVPHCVAGVRAVQPHGPYLLAGLCFGGVVALEMSRQLRAEGEEVALTVMIDSFAPGAATQAQGDELALAGRPTERQAAGGKRRLTPRRLVLKSRARAWRAAWGPIHGFYRTVGRPMPDWLRDVEEANTIASDNYQARTYDGDVTLLRATETVDLATDRYHGWDRYITGRLDSAEVTGGHVSMYEEPHASALAEALAVRIAGLSTNGAADHG